MFLPKPIFQRSNQVIKINQKQSFRISFSSQRESSEDLNHSIQVYKNKIYVMVVLSWATKKQFISHIKTSHINKDSKMSLFLPSIKNDCYIQILRKRSYIFL